jgi:D-beta-D-heptose 7-phosphate kinase/D-beta-D-heptose 1-phosphate adenosyltransferase
MKIIVVSGGFDPIHSGHLSYFNEAKKIGDKLIVALNSDEWLSVKKGKNFMSFDERKAILENLVSVDEVIGFEDDKKGSCINALKKVLNKYKNDEIIFCNGGDRNKDNIPEMELDGIKFLFGVGGDKKMNSSSNILKEYYFESENRIWGKFYNLFIDDNVKVKELILDQGKGISYQKHFYRSELWFVSKGKCKIRYSEDDADNFKEIILKKNDIYIIKKNSWHQLINDFSKPCHIIEIQYGEKRSEDDIERLYFYEGNELKNDN